MHWTVTVDEPIATAKHIVPVEAETKEAAIRFGVDRAYSIDSRLKGELARSKDIAARKETTAVFYTTAVEDARKNRLSKVGALALLVIAILATMHGARLFNDAATALWGVHVQDLLIGLSTLVLGGWLFVVGVERWKS